MKQLEDKIISLITAEKLTQVENVCNSSHLMNDLGLDSLSIIRLQVVLEDEFTCEFDPLSKEMFDAFQTIGTLAVYIQKMSVLQVE